ncbi:sodium ion-translocating decarboxylase subunit beta [Colidextribacter sp. OB.20]|uniref:sodium ion-translocating decarboxylase subunit beta n=1 Tax=Colidextribacter sp. OB.20 TaxID=2304568 RepID=UPI001371B31B|nr:sodium ion-translocating decarboxylase subunit beta [Colidextribacter sp. OB.20]MCI9295390.1 sodium ion-translocating decarboxylase subunit beta [Lawsonibacter sp.]NBI09082.1 sodium ion-translocating decarboxylase subunit beta [Colidextribacter sp. OB.20]
MEFLKDVIFAIANGSGFAAILSNPDTGLFDWRTLVMLFIACVLLYMGIGKGYEPLLMVPIAFGMLLANLPITGLFAEPVYDAATHSGTVGFMWVLYQGVQWAIYPSIIFMGIGAMTDFGPLLANPTSLLLGAAAQLGIFAAFLMALALGFTPAEAAAIGVIGGADGPTAILTASKLAVELLPAIAIAAYSYMALIPMIQPPLMKALTSKKARQVKMGQLRVVSKTEKIIFPIAVTIFVVLLVPDTAPLIGMLMLGNLFRESGVTERLSDTAQNALINIVTIPLGLSVGFKAVGSTFLTPQTLGIIILGLTAFLLSTAGGLILGDVMYILTKGKVNPLIGSAGVSAVPMAARVAQNVGQKENPSNFLLMHAMGPNVAGVIGSACAAGFMIKVFGG